MSAVLDEVERQEQLERLANIGRAALLARQLVADLDTGRGAAAVDAAVAGLRCELDAILGALEPLPEEWRRVVAPALSPGQLSARDDRGDPPLFEDMT